MGARRKEIAKTVRGEFMRQCKICVRKWLPDLTVCVCV